MNLMGEAARTQNNDTKILRIALDRNFQRLAKLVATVRCRNWELEDAHLKRYDGDAPFAGGEVENRQGRETTMVEQPVPKERQVELLLHQGLADMTRELRMPREGRQRSGAASFVGWLVRVVDAERERRIVVKKEARNVIIVDYEQDVGRDAI